MATFEEQVEALTGLTINSSGTVPTQAQLTDFLTQGGKEVINRTIAANPETKMEFSATTNDSNNSGLTINGDIISVVREHDSTSILRPCSKINAKDRYEASDSTSLKYRSKYNPGWYELNGKVFVVPISASGNNDSVVTQITYPAIPYGDTNWSYPAKYETLIAYYGSMMSLLAKAGSLQADSDVTDALTAINTELDECLDIADDAHTAIGNAGTEIGLAKTEAAEIASLTDNSGDIATALTAINTAADKFRTDASDPGVFGHEDNYLSSDSGIARVLDPLTKAQKLMDDGANVGGDNASATATSAQYWLSEEDPEMVDSTLKLISVELKRAEANMQEWNAAVNALNSEIEGFKKEVEGRVAFSGAKGQAVKSYITTAQAFIAQADSFGKEVASKVQISTGYIQEAGIRMKYLQQEYQWYTHRYNEIEQKYDAAFLSEEQIQKKRLATQQAAMKARSKK